MIPPGNSSSHRHGKIQAGGTISAKLKSGESRVRVAVRCRPMSVKEISNGHQSIVEFEGNDKIIIHDVSESPSDHLGTKSGERQNSSRTYDFDAVFDCASSQTDVYDRVCKPIVESVLEGYNGTIFAYGQTGTGKTYTMEGSSKRDQRKPSRDSGKSIITAKKLTNSVSKSREPSADDGKSGNVGGDSNEGNPISDQSEGIIPRAFEQIFGHISNHSEVQFLIRASYLEIYQEEIHDLLRKDRSIKLELHESPDIGVYVKDLTSFVCKSITEIERVMRVGNQNRMVGATDMNEHSSRSHAIFMITVEQQQQSRKQLDNSINHNRRQQMIGGAERSDEKKHVIRVGKLNLVDLAGSERQRKTNSLGQRQRESIKINLSLSALGNVINSLMDIHSNKTKIIANAGNDKGTNFTPYRDSKLTRLLQDSLGGNAKTLMIANIGPASYNYDETINTLNYASRAKWIRNCPRLNEDPKDALLRELQREIADLRTKLAAINYSNGNKPDAEESLKQTNKAPAIDKDTIEKELTDLRQKLQSLEGKLLNGGSFRGSEHANLDHKNLLEGYTNEQELELERRREELADQVNREKAIRDELEHREEAELLALESFSSIQQELDAKRRLIRQIRAKIKTMRDCVEANQKGYRLELDELDQLQYVLHKELKLKCLIMDNFIPNHHVDQLLPRIVYDEAKSFCQVLSIDLPVQGECRFEEAQLRDSDDNLWSQFNDNRRLRSESETIGEIIYPTSIRYKFENLIEPKLTMPDYGTPKQLGLNNVQNDEEDYDDEEGSGELSTASRIQTLIDKALSQHEPNIVI